ncbi:MAG: hypothetical protein ACK5QC_00555 [Bacteroidota bacterium]
MFLSQNLNAQAPTTFSATTLRADTIKSNTVIKADAITATDTIRAKENVIAEHDIKVAGVLDVAGTANFKTKVVLGTTPSNGITMQYVPGTSNYPSLFKFSAPGGTGILNGGNGGTIAPEDSQPNLTCINGPIPGIANAFSQMVSVAFNPTNPSITGGQVLIGHNGVNAFFDTQGTGALSNPSTNHPGDLFINGFCNRNVLFFGHSTPFGANATNIVSIDGALNVRQRLQLGYNSASTFVEPNNKLYVLNDVASIGEAIKIKNGSSSGAGLRVSTYNSAKAISVTQNTSFAGDGAETFYIDGDGKTTIKTNNTDALNILDASNNQAFKINNDGKTTIKTVNIDAFNVLNASNNVAFVIKSDGKTYIGNQKPKVGGPHINAMLAVDGKILAKEVFVNIHNSVWADYVFDKNYKLMSLTDVENFIKKEKHLPNIPSEVDLKVNDLNIAEMQKLQMEKIEELYLYVIEQQKQINELKKENEALRKQIVE